MDKLKEFLSGKKTVIGGIAMILLGIKSWIDGTMPDGEVIRTILEGIIVITGRQAIAKINQ